MKIIKYNGQTLKTNHYIEMEDKEYYYLKNEYFKLPIFQEVKKQILNIANGGVKDDKITNYYFLKLMVKTKLYSCKWSIEDVFNSKELLSYFWVKTQLNSKVFLSKESVKRKLDTTFRLGGKGVAKKPNKFPVKKVDEILKKYNINNNYYDFSCGWGTRLTSSLKNKVNYFGTEPNYLLTEKLIQFANDYKEITKQNTIVDIRTQGSEEFIPEWENKMGVAFSSPPYYKLEDYKIGNQSYKEGVTYYQWLENYLKPTIINIYYYLVDDGYFLLNINDFDEYKLVEDSIKIAENNNFYLVGEEILEGNKRCKSTNGFNDNSEKILVFAKTNKNNNIPHGQTSIYDYIKGSDKE
jgi:hypothetical protein